MISVILAQTFPCGDPQEAFRILEYSANGVIHQPITYRVSFENALLRRRHNDGQ
jgi:hypothetical protein